MYLNLIAPINDLGYGIHSRGIIKGLNDNGFSNYRLDCIGQRSGELSSNEILLTNQLLSKPWNRDSICVKIWHEYQMNDLSGKKIVPYPVFETTKLFDKAIHDLKQMDAIIVTSKWAKDVMRDNIGEGVPIFIVNESGQWFEEDTEEEKFKTFTFLHVGKFEVRKCTPEMIKVYGQVFENKEETRFIIHCFNPFDKNFLENIVKVLEYEGFKIVLSTDDSKIIALRGNAIIEVPRTRISKKDLFKLYKKSHFGVYPSKGEGWNLDLFESITNDLPCIASYVSSHTEYLSEEWEYPKELLLTEGKEEAAFDNIWFKGDRGNWVAPNLGELSDKMLYAYTDYDSIRNRFNTDKIKNHFTWKRAGESLIKICEDLN